MPTPARLAIRVSNPAPERRNQISPRSSSILVFLRRLPDLALTEDGAWRPRRRGRSQPNPLNQLRRGEVSHHHLDYAGTAYSKNWEVELPDFSYKCYHSKPKFNTLEPIKVQEISWHQIPITNNTPNSTWITDSRALHCRRSLERLALLTFNISFSEPPYRRRATSPSQRRILFHV